MIAAGEEEVGGANLVAFLDMLAEAEGTSKLGDNGYNVLVGGGLFDSYSDHPCRLIEVRPGLKSTAAGRYQLLCRFWRGEKGYKATLGLADFSPRSQDLVAIQQIRECRAFGWIQRGHLEEAIQKCAHIWASLPGAGYGQQERLLSYLVAAYQAAGGIVV